MKTQPSVNTCDVKDIDLRWSWLAGETILGEKFNQPCAGAASRLAGPPMSHPVRAAMALYGRVSF